jgi:non-ribosomal peptide synthetase component F
LKEINPRIVWLECEAGGVLNMMAEQKPIRPRDMKPPHQLTVYVTDDHGVFCKLELGHAISDGTSVPIILRDLSQAYQEIATGNESQSKGPLYSEYVSCISSTSDADLNYWKAYLTGIETCHFPILNYGKKEKEHRSITLELTGVPELSNFCTKNGLTFSNVLQLAWGLVLRLYTGSEEICFGYVTSGRDALISGIQDSALGTFINMLVCRLYLSENIQLGQALGQIQADFAQGTSHQSFSLADMQHELQLSGTSLSNTVFTYQRRATPKHTSESTLDFDVLESHDPTEYNIAVNVEAFDSSVTVHFGYWANNLSQAQATNMANTFNHTLNMIVCSHNNSQTIGEMDFFSEQSRQQVMMWNQSLPMKIERCLHEMIDGQRLRLPASAQAVCSWDASLTYTELDRLATKIAIHLVRLGTRPDVFVAICFEKSIWVVVSMIAVLKAGGAFVPLDHSHPQNRLKHLINDIGAKAVLCSQQNQQRLMEVAKTFVVDRSAIDQLVAHQDMPLLYTATPNNAAYTIFTSSTTGNPKGTVVEHAAICTSATYFQQRTPNDSGLSCLSVSVFHIRCLHYGDLRYANCWRLYLHSE